MNIVISILVFSLLILFHELGHFTLAKLNGIRVNEFSLGLGPTIIGFTKGETKYSLKLLPFGGACMMEGEDADRAGKNLRLPGILEKIDEVRGMIRVGGKEIKRNGMMDIDGV